MFENKTRVFSLPERKGNQVGTVSDTIGIDSLTSDQGERLRLHSLRKCIEQLNSKPRKIREGKRICQPVMVWSVNTATRSVVPGSDRLTFACELAPTAMTFLVNRRDDDTHAVVEFLDGEGKAQARFLVKVLETNATIRGFYAIHAKVLCRVPSHPTAAIFNKGYFLD